MDLPLSRFNVLLPLLESLIWTASARYILFCGVSNFMALDSGIRKTSHRIRPLPRVITRLTSLGCLQHWFF
jgi:hypothetical protein